MPSVHHQPSSHHRLVVVGDVMTDVVARANDPMGPGVDTAAEVSTGQGGAGANVAHWLARLGTPVAFVGSVGSDPFGREAVDVLVAAGVDVHVRTDPHLPTGTCVVLVGEHGERTLLPDAGANSALRPEDLPLDVLRAASWVHISGYTLLNPGSREAGLTAVRAAREAGVPTSVDAASTAALQAVGGKVFLALTDDVDVAFCTLEQAEVLCDSREPSVVSARLTATYPQLVLTLGPGGAMWSCAQDVGGCQVAAASPSDPVVDSTGAVDAFSAAYLAAVSSPAARLGGPSPLVPPAVVVRDALARACELAAGVVTRHGSRPE